MRPRHPAVALRKSTRAALAAIVLLMAAAPVAAFPEGAPFDMAGAPGQENCTACHFSADAVNPSRSLALEGAGKLTPGEKHRLTVRLNEAAPRAGFVLVARLADGSPAGRFEAADGRAESAPSGAAIRSTEEGSRPQEEVASWSVVWVAPTAPGRLTFVLAAVAGNDDASPFGDIVHLRRIDACSGC